MSAASTSKYADLSALTISEDQRGGSSSFIALFWILIFIALLGGVGYGGLIIWKRLEIPVVATTRLILRKPSGPVTGGGLLTANGYVIARQEASISPRTTGLLANLLVDVGNQVFRGQQIALLEQERAKAFLQAAQARLEAAKSQANVEQTELQKARDDLKKQDALWKKGVVPQQKVDDAKAVVATSEARYKALQAAIDVARADVVTAEVDLDYTIVRAPFDGIVTEKHVEEGEIVAPVPASSGGRDAGILTIANMGNLEVEVDVSEAYISRLSTGLPAQITLDAYSRDPYRGRVRQIVPTANREKATVKVKVLIIEPDEKVLPDMGAKVSFLEEELPQQDETQDEEEKLFVDSRAVQRNSEGAYVFLIDANKAVFKAIKTGDVRGNEVEVLEGLQPGASVILEPPEKLKDGDEVRVQ